MLLQNGVEVVLNRLDPGTIQGRLSSLSLEEIMAVDTEDDAVAAGVDVALSQEAALRV